MIDSYKSRSGHDCRYTTYNLSNFFKDQTEKIEEERQKLSKKMKEVKYPKWDEAYDGLSYDEMKEFVSMLTARIDAVRGRINLIKGSIIQENSALMQPLGYYDAQIDMENQRKLAYYDALFNMENQRTMMMMNNGASCSQSTSYSNYGYSFDENQVYNYGLGNEMMQNGGVTNVDPLMCYYVPDNGQRVLMSGTFPQVQAAREGDYVGRHGF